MMLPGLDTEADRRELETDKLERGDDPTPRELVRVILAEAMPVIMREVGEDHPGLDLDLDALDVCAGYGCWASEIRRHAQRTGYEIEITGLEICEDRREHLAKWCDSVVIGDWFAALADHHEPPQFDVIIGNPKFKLLVDDSGDPSASMPAVLLLHAPAVLLLHQTTNLQRGTGGCAVWRAYPPAHVWLVPGAVGFRGPGHATDSRCYQATLWLRGHTGPATVSMLDGPEVGAQWRWTVPPGSEQPSDELPAAPGWSP